MERDAEAEIPLGEEDLGGGGETQTQEEKYNAFIPNVEDGDEVSTTDHEDIVKRMLQFIAMTVEETIDETALFADRLVKLQNIYMERGTPLPNDLSWNIWCNETKEFQLRLENLNLEFDPNCVQIFSHRFYLLAVYIYPKYSYDLSHLLLGYLENQENKSETKENIVSSLLDHIYAVFDKATIFDDYLDPPDLSSPYAAECLAHRNRLEAEFPTLKLVKSDKKMLREKLRARYMNTAIFFANLMLVIHGRGYEETFHKFLHCLTQSMDVTKFLALDQILGICGFLIKSNQVLNGCLTSLADFVDQLDPNHPKITKLRKMLKRIYLELVRKPKMEIPNKLKLLYQIYPSQMKLEGALTTMDAADDIEEEANDEDYNGGDEDEGDEREPLF